MAANLFFEEKIIQAQIRKECTHETTLYEGAQVKAELGTDELDEVVPAGKKWEIVFNIRLVETDA